MAEEDTSDSGELIRNKIAIAEPNFSLSIESDETLATTKKAFEQLMKKYSDLGKSKQ